VRTSTPETAASRDPIAGRRWGSHPEMRVAALSVALVVGISAVHAFRLGHLAERTGLISELIPAATLTALFAVTEGFAIHLRVRRGGHAMSLSEVPMVLGMLAIHPTLLLVSRLVGGGLGLLALRRQRGMKLMFNLALIGVQATIPPLVFHALTGQPAVLGPKEWFAAYAAMLLSDASAAVLVTAAIALHDDPGEWRRVTRALRGLPLVAVSTTIALIGAMAVESDIRALALLAVLGLVTYTGYRAYVRQSQGHAQVEELYTFTRALDGSSDTVGLAGVVLTQVRDQLRAETAELIVPFTGAPSDEGEAPAHGFMRTRLKGAGEVTTDWMPALPNDAWWSRAAGHPVLLPADKDRIPVNAIAVPVPMGDGVGVLLVCDSLPDQPTFTEEHVKLFQALANHASVALSKSLLVDRLRYEVAQKEYVALHDLLTGLPNRRRFNQLVEEAVAANQRAAVILMDLDRFKEINDALGHDTGDALLREIGPRLQRRLGTRGVVARLGGDEFAVLLPGVGRSSDAVTVGAELTAELEAPIPVGQLQLNTRASVGIALAPEHGDDAKTLLQRADVAMYSAKDTRSGNRVYQPEQDRNTPHRLALIGELEKAIARRDLLVVFQPKVDPANNLVIGAEALARWHHAEQGFIPPDQFIPLAEHSGLIRPLTLHVLEVALRRCAAWRRAGHEMSVAVNLSPNSLLDTSLPDVVSRLLGQTGIPPKALTLEITESSIMIDPAGSLRTLEALNTLGVKLAIDDFGTGYSSLGRLRELPIHEVKVDKSFVGRMAVDHRDRAVVRSAIQLGHALDLEVVAEGVEDSETYAHLAAEGCNIIQGYFISRPLPADEFMKWLHEHNSRPIELAAPAPEDKVQPGNVVYPRFGG
jgi:diguanylate cyclase (GGDEF)-like protein